MHIDDEFLPVYRLLCSVSGRAASNRMRGVRLHGAVRMRCAVLSAFACWLDKTADERIAGLHRVSCPHHWLSLERTHLRYHAVPRGHHLW